jgi:hypothetical protein
MRSSVGGLRLTPASARVLAKPCRLRQAGPPPRPVEEPARVQRLADRPAGISVYGQRIGLGRGYANAP